MTTLSDSTPPKSGLAVAVSWKFGDGRQKKSAPRRLRLRPSTLSSPADTKGKMLYCCRGFTPVRCRVCRAEMNLGTVAGSPGQPQRWSKCATLRDM